MPSASRLDCSPPLLPAAAAGHRRAAAACVQRPAAGQRRRESFRISGERIPEQPDRTACPEKAVLFFSALFRSFPRFCLFPGSGHPSCAESRSRRRPSSAPERLSSFRQRHPADGARGRLPGRPAAAFSGRSVFFPPGPSGACPRPCAAIRSAPPELPYPSGPPPRSDPPRHRSRRLPFRQGPSSESRRMTFRSSQGLPAAAARGPAARGPAAPEFRGRGPLPRTAQAGQHRPRISSAAAGLSCSACGG